MTSRMGTLTGWLRSIWSRKASTAQVLKSGFHSGQPSPLVSGSSSVEGALERLPESPPPPFSTMPVTLSDMDSRLKNVLGLLTEQLDRMFDKIRVLQSGSAQNVFLLNEVANLRAAVVATSSRLNLELWKKSPGPLPKLHKSKSRRVERDKKSVVRQRSKR